MAGCGDRYEDGGRRPGNEGIDVAAKVGGTGKAGYMGATRRRVGLREKGGGFDNGWAHATPADGTAALWVPVRLCGISASLGPER